MMHAFIVDGEDDVLAVHLRLGSREEYEGFHDRFRSSFRSRAPFHAPAAKCEECRPGLDEWAPLFFEWVRDSYAHMPVPPSPVEPIDVPEVVRLSMESLYGRGADADPSGLN